MYVEVIILNASGDFMCAKHMIDKPQNSKGRLADEAAKMAEEVGGPAGGKACCDLSRCSGWKHRGPLTMDVPQHKDLTHLIDVARDKAYRKSHEVNIPSHLRRRN